MSSQDTMSSQTVLLEKLLDTTVQDIIPLTRKGVEKGCKVFGAAILLKKDLSLVIAETNNEIVSPLLVSSHMDLPGRRADKLSMCSMARSIVSKSTGNWTQVPDLHRKTVSSTQRTNPAPSVGNGPAAFGSIRWTETHFRSLWYNVVWI
jgi:hypothetical protein